MNNTQRPNILVIMSDQHHAGIMGCAGDPWIETPHLDGLAERGIRFSNAYCPFPLCGPSRMSFLTGRHPHALEIWDNESELRSDIPTMTHAFLAGGYETILAGRMHFVGADQRHGYQHRLVGDVPESAYLAAGWKLKTVLGDLADTPGMSLTGIVKSGPGRTGYQAYDEVVTDATVQWLRERAGKNQPMPFFLTVGYAAPHCPFVAPPDDFERYRSRLTPADCPPPDPALHPINAARRQRFGIDPAPPGDAQWRTRVAYYGLCAFLDRQIGAVLAALESSGQAENTIVVYCSDHGEMLGEHGLWWKSYFYDGASRVPLIITLPGNTAAGTCRHENVSLMDIGPSLLDLAGLKPLPGATGRSVTALINGRERQRDDTVFAEYAERGSAQVCRMLRSGPWKYNYYHGMAPELFNLHDDPGETTNLAGQTCCRSEERRLHDRVLQDWHPDHVAECMQRRQHEMALIGHAINVSQPAEPDPLWFNAPPDNWVDTSVSAISP